MAGRIEALLSMLERGQDAALLRYSLGNEYLAVGEPVKAALHLEQAVTLDPGYSAAWKLLGRALAESGRDDDAIAAYRRGIAVAEEKGDRQAGREMAVFLRRLEKKASR